MRAGLLWKVGPRVRAALAALSLTLPGCAFAQAACADRDCAASLLRGHLVTQPDFWMVDMENAIR